MTSHKNNYKIKKSHSLKIFFEEGKLFMSNLLKIKKGKISIFILLVFNQFLFSAYALNNKRIYKFDSSKDIFINKAYRESNFLLTEKINDNESLIKYAEDIEKYIENVFESDYLDNFKEKTKQLPTTETNSDKSDEDSNIEDGYNKNLPSEKNKNPDNFKDKSGDLENFKEKTKQLPTTKTNSDKSDKDSINEDVYNKNLPSENSENRSESKDKKEIIKRIDSRKNNLNKLPLPSKSKISTSEFKVKARGYVNLKGPKLTLNLEGSDAKETLKLIGKLGNYGVVIIEDKDLSKKQNSTSSKITATFENVDFSDVFNSILFSANLQAVVEKNIIFVGENILNKSIKPKISKTYRLNQVSSASVADYLSTLGAKISKVMLVSGTLEGTEIRDTYVNKKEFKDELKNPYGIEGGPLFGLIGTTDLRLQTITLIGSKDLIKTAEKYIKALDLRHRQVALTIKIIDVALTNADLKQNLFEFKSGETEIINNAGLGVKTGNFNYGNGNNANIQNILNSRLAGGQFFNWLEAKITNEKAKVLASPTLILGENPNFLASGAAKVDDSLLSASIGRPYKNEGFIKVGETVVTGFTQTANEGIVTCTATEGTAGITFGAKVEKIDDNGFVTFALSPAISSVTKTVEIAGCGVQNTLSVRKLDTGSIRVKNGSTLILTGVLKDEVNKTESKVPILGDIPVLGGLFRKNVSQKRKSELIILVTPKILKDQ